MKVDLLKLNNDESNRLLRKYLRNAFDQLIREIPFNKITITALCKKAGVSRTAFYNNYKSIDDVLEDTFKCYNDLILKSFGKPFDKDVTKDWYISFFRVVKERSALIKILLDAGFQDKYIDITNDYINKNPDVITIEEAYKRYAWNGALQVLMRKWILDGMKEDEEFMGELAYKLLKR